MKNKLQIILVFIGVLVVVFSGCQKQDPLVAPATISNKTSNTTDENKKNKDGRDDKRFGHTFDDTFTKWIFDYPFMMGVVGGDVGTGTYAGEVLSLNTVGDITTVDALYHFNGKFHSFTAHVFVTENDAPGVGAAVITGRVTEGWLEGAAVTGEYKVWGACPIPTPGNIEGTRCYQGVLHVHVPKDERD